MFTYIIKKLKFRQNLTEGETEQVFVEIMSGKLETKNIAEFLLLLKEKKETVEEITGAAKVMRRFATCISPKCNKLLDTCGTGGDNANTFNISTISAFVACGAGCFVAKHGNKAVSSSCGSADLLEDLGANINLAPLQVQRCIEEVGMGFLFAPLLHPAMKYAMPARKMLKTRSIFNILGPLTNPAGARYQLLGVYTKELTEVLAGVLKRLGSKGAMVVHGFDGLDEITVTDKTFVTELKNDTIKNYTISPEEFGFSKANLGSLRCENRDVNKRMALDILNGKDGARRDIILFNAGAAIYITGLACDLREGIKKAAESIDSGSAYKKLKRFIEYTKQSVKSR